MASPPIYLAAAAALMPYIPLSHLKGRFALTMHF
jgi:hypothetical protein